MDAPKATVNAFWETRFYLFDWPGHAEHADALTGFLFDLKAAQSRNIESGVAPSAKSERALYEGDFDLFRRTHPSLDALKSFIGVAVQHTVAHVNGAKVAPGRILVEVVESWFHITEDGGFHDVHGHPGCSWCGIYYLKLGQSAPARAGGAPNGLNRFYAPLTQGGAHRDYGSAYLDRGYVDPPVKEGALLLFPSYLQHSALPYRGADPRVIISFNSRSHVAAAAP